MMIAVWIACERHEAWVVNMFNGWRENTLRIILAKGVVKMKFDVQAKQYARFYYGVRDNGVRHAKQGDDAAAFTRRQGQPLAIGARDERRRRHSRAPTLRRYAAMSLLPYSMAYLRAVQPFLQRSE
jgi:hypothetical protein